MSFQFPIRSRLTPLVLSLVLPVTSGCGAEAAEDPAPNTAMNANGAVQTPSGPAGGAAEEEEAAPPPTPEPNAAPPPPTANGAPPPPPATAPTAAPPPAPPPPVAADPRPVYTPEPSAPTGQWVYADGRWVWMPYEQSYTYVTPSEDDAYEYVYYPDTGWAWMHAPWIIGIGPRPYWGRVGPVRFAWYAHPWFHPRRAYYYRHPGYYRGGGGRRGYRR